MASLSGFDARTVEPNEGFDILPAGDYDAVIVKSELVETKDKTGKMLKMEFQILSGKFQNRKLFCNLGIGLSEATDGGRQAVKIAKGNLSAICRAVGVLTPSDSSELHNKPLRITVKIRPPKGQYAASNEISSFKSRTAGPVSPEPQPAFSQSVPAPVADPALAAAPWG